jgi:hypothetical protein
MGISCRWHTITWPDWRNDASGGRHGQEIFGPVLVIIPEYFELKSIAP